MSKPKQPQAKTLSLFDLSQMFPDEDTAIVYLSGILWPNGPVCPFCGGDRISPRTAKNVHRCKDCRKDFTIRVGTIFHRSHIALHKWLYAMYLVVTARKGISSLQLSKELDIDQKSAWFLLQRIRFACGNQTTKILSGIVEADETFIGGKEHNKHANKRLNQGRGTVGKTPVFGMRDRGGQVVAQVVNSTDAPTLQGIIKKSVVPGSAIATDEHGAYRGLNGPFIHKAVCHSAKNKQSAKKWVDGWAHTNGIESVWALLKRGFYGIFHNFSVKHMQLYVNECTFRLNEGNCKYDTVDRLKALAQGMKGKRLTYAALTKGSYHQKP